MTDYEELERLTLIRDMNEFAVGWHRQGKCSCMDAFDPSEINEKTFVGCDHLNEGQWQFFKNRVNELDEVYREKWHSKLMGARK